MIKKISMWLLVIICLTATNINAADRETMIKFAEYVHTLNVDFKTNTGHAVIRSFTCQPDETLILRLTSMTSYTLTQNISEDAKLDCEDMIINIIHVWHQLTNNYDSDFKVYLSDGEPYPNDNEMRGNSI